VTIAFNPFELEEYRKRVREVTNEQLIAEGKVLHNLVYPRMVSPSPIWCFDLCWWAIMSQDEGLLSGLRSSFPDTESVESTSRYY
jgi:hypothetical protein